MMKKITAFGTLTTGLLLKPAAVLAGPPIYVSISPPENVKIVDLGRLISALVGLILVIASLAAFIYLILGGLQWITSGGDKGKVEAAQHRIQAALLGLIIVFAVWALFIVVEKFLGISILQGIRLDTPWE